MSEKDIIHSKINIIKNCLMAIEKAQLHEKDPDFKMGLYEEKICLKKISFTLKSIL
jgi:hypothetical protein